MQAERTAVPHTTTDWPWKIPLRRRDGSIRAYALVDEEDFSAVTAYRWHIHAGETGDYAARNVRLDDGRQWPSFLHRELLGLALGDPRRGDHRNRDRLDNRRANLRIATHAQNVQNVGANRGSSSPHRGVSRRPNGRWQAEVQVDGRRWYLGVFDSEDAAAAIAAEFRRQRVPFSAEAAA